MAILAPSVNLEDGDNSANSVAGRYDRATWPWRAAFGRCSRL
jgi:hypothetical protein